MSLVTLTFGENNSAGSEHVEIVTANARFLSDAKQTGVMKVSKIDKFGGTDELCVLGELVSGMICEHMLANGMEVPAEIMEVSSKYGKAVARPGTKLLVMVKGLSRENVRVDSQIEFVKKPEAPKPKGRLIIC